MGLHIVRVLRQGIWASLTGGWYFEPEQHILPNTLQMYFWFLLIFLPFSLYLNTSTGQSNTTSCIYTLVVGVIYVTILFLCYYLHRLFDHAETVEEKKESVANETTPTDEEANINAVEPGRKKSSNEEPEESTNRSVADFVVVSLNNTQTSRNESQESMEVTGGASGASEPKAVPKGDIKAIEEHPNVSVMEKNELEFTDWKDFMWPPQSSRMTPVVCTNFRPRRAPESGLRAESFQTRSSFHIPEDYERSEDGGKKVYSANDMKVQSTGDMKEMIRDGKSLLSSDSESFEVERNHRTDTSESLLATGSGRMNDTKKDFSKIMSEPQLTEDHKTPTAQPVKPKRVRLKVDDQILSDNDSVGMNPSSSSSVPLRSQSSDLPTSAFDLGRQLIIQEVEEESEVVSPLSTKQTEQCSGSEGDNLATVEVMDMKCASSSSFSSNDEKSPKPTLRSSSEDVQSRKLSSGTPMVYIPETLVNTLPPEKARQILDDEEEHAHSSDALAVTSRRSSRPRAVNASKFFNVLTDGRLDVNSAVISDHNDTTPGSVHYFEDEAGNWIMYQFADAPDSHANDDTDKNNRSSTDAIAPAGLSELEYELPSTSSGIRFRGFGLQQPADTREASLPSVYSDFSETDENTFVSTQSFGSTRRGIRNILRVSNTYNDVDPVDLLGFLQDTTSGASSDQLRRPLMELGILDAMSNTPSFRGLFKPPGINNVNSSPVKPKYRLFVSKAKSLSFVVNFDRQQLSTLMDVRHTFFENLFVVILSMMVAFLGFKLLSVEIYHDLLMFAVCFVIAGSQYSLIKSVQPDSASPMHGYNRVIVFSRALYFCLFAGSLLILHSFLPCNSQTSSTFTLYSIDFNTCDCIKNMHFVLTWLIVLLPIIFLLGLLPQCTTFLLFSFEQLDVHVFGGTAKASLLGSALSSLVSVITVSLLSFLSMWAVDHANRNNQFLFTFYCSLLPPIGYFLSRIPSEPSFFTDLFRQTCMKPNPTEGLETQELPRTLKKIFGHRLQNSLFVCPILFILFFALHISKIFSEPIMTDKGLDILFFIAGGVGFLSNYLLPQLRKRLPWLYFDKPCLPLKAELNRNADFSLQQAKVLIHEYFHIWIQIFEKYILNIAVIIAIVTRGLPALTEKYNMWIGCFLGTTFALKLLRYNFCTLSRMYQVILLGAILFGHDLRAYSELPLMDFFVATLVIPKGIEVFKKLQFVFTYVAPWQIPWGSTFHAFAQPVSIPHSALLFTQAFVSSLLSAPLSPFMGSAMFIMSYPRPVKFWEKDYKTKRQDVTNRRLALHLDPSPVGDEDGSLNSIYYEHLARSLQIYLAGDIAFGRWGNVEQGNFFLMASENLNCLVHIVEVGNGFVTFQVRGLEFRGTYCHQREVDAINEEPSRDQGFCCCSVKKVPGLLSLNEAFSQRWLAWEVLTNSYIIDGYDIIHLNAAQNNFASYEQKSTHSKLYVQSVIFLLVRCKKLDIWLKDDSIIAALHENGYTNSESLPVLDPAFDAKHHHDYDPQASGITREKFCQIHLPWIQYCASQQKNISESVTEDSDIVSLCFALAIYARRALLDACNHHYEFYLFGIHALFKGAFSPSSTKDQWLFTDLDLVDLVVKPAIRMSIRLHLDNFISHDFLSPLDRLYSIIDEYERVAVFAHESDPKWREAILNNTEKLLTLRHVVNESCELYRIITLHKKFLSFKIVKLNQECVRGLWAGQQNELIFLRNSNSERGSIQNARQALRNIINSSCDQPIGYPIYVSPLITSFIDSNKSVPKFIGESLKFSSLKNVFVSSWASFIERCLDGCTSGRYSSGATYANDQNTSPSAMDLSSPPNYIAMTKHHRPSDTFAIKDTTVPPPPPPPPNLAAQSVTMNETNIFVSASTLHTCNDETTL